MHINEPNFKIKGLILILWLENAILAYKWRPEPIIPMKRFQKNTLPSGPALFKHFRFDILDPAFLDLPFLMACGNLGSINVEPHQKKKKNHHTCTYMFFALFFFFNLEEESASFWRECLTLSLHWDKQKYHYFVLYIFKGEGSLRSWMRR